MFSNHESVRKKILCVWKDSPFITAINTNHKIVTNYNLSIIDSWDFFFSISGFLSSLLASEVGCEATLL
jgi:hypothetical protein